MTTLGSKVNSYHRLDIFGRIYFSAAKCYNLYIIYINSLIFKMKQLVINTSLPEGQCLTSDNYQHVGIEHFYVRLEDLLVKPGIQVLLKLKSLKKWLGFKGAVYLDIILPVNKQGVVAIKSPYDGSVIKPSPNDIQLFLQTVDADEQLTDIEKINFDVSLCKDGFDGFFYNDRQRISIQSAEMALDFNPLQQDCPCPACHEGLTRAYLSHLYQHVPLLCQRFLIQHNLVAYEGVS